MSVENPIGQRVPPFRDPAPVMFELVAISADPELGGDAEEFIEGADVEGYVVRIASLADVQAALLALPLSQYNDFIRDTLMKRRLDGGADVSANPIDLTAPGPVRSPF